MGIRARVAVLLVCAASLAAPRGAAAQDWSSSPWASVSFFSDSSRTTSGAAPSGFDQFTTAVTYQMPDTDTDGVDYGIDLRYSEFDTASEPRQVSLYDGWVGVRFADGTMRARAGNMWLNDLGALGSVAGGLFEYRQKRAQDSDGRFRFGAFAGLEPDILDAGYASGVTKMGGYAAYDGKGAWRDVLGFVTIRDQSLTERSVVTTMNFLPIQQKLFVYQAAEYDVTPPAGQGPAGLTYLFANVRYLPTDRIELQGIYNRGRSIDTRGLSDAILSGQPLTQQQVSGLLYDSTGGRITVEVVRGVHAYVGYSQDRNDVDSGPTNRTLLGVYASNVGNTGFDLTGSDSLMNGPLGRFQAEYFSVGHQIGRKVYLEGDYSTSLSLVQFSRTDGIVVTTQPHTRLFSGTSTINLGRTISLLITAERYSDDQSSNIRLLSGITYRFQPAAGRHDQANRAGPPAPGQAGQPPGL